MHIRLLKKMQKPYFQLHLIMYYTCNMSLLTSLSSSVLFSNWTSPYDLSSMPFFRLQLPGTPPRPIPISTYETCKRHVLFLTTPHPFLLLVSLKHPFVVWGTTPVGSCVLLSGVEPIGNSGSARVTQTWPNGPTCIFCRIDQKWALCFWWRDGAGDKESLEKLVFLLTYTRKQPV